MPFSMFSRRWLSNFPKHASISVLHSRHRVLGEGVSIVDGDDDESAEIE